MTPPTLEFDVHVQRTGKGSRKTLAAGPPPAPVPDGRVPRISRLMALAIHLDGLIRSGVVADYAAAAGLGHVTRARVTQVMNLLNLAPDLQEALLFLPRVERGRDPIVLRQLQPIARATDWRAQRRLWRRAAGERTGDKRVGTV